MIEILGRDVGFWMGLIAGLLILLHVPSCNKHWADRLKPFSLYLRKYHDLTLVLATLFALAHIVLALVGLVFGIWV